MGDVIMSMTIQNQYKVEGKKDNSHNETIVIDPK